jgi:hypothetical protein
MRKKLVKFDCPEKTGQMNTFVRILNILLLAAILVMLVRVLGTLVEIRQHMPPTIGEFRQANGHDRAAE